MLRADTIKKIISLYKAIEDKDESFNRALHSCSTDFSDGIFTAEIYTATNELVKDLVDDEVFSWIDWFIWEDDFGSKKLEAGYKNKIFQIKNIKDFIKLLQTFKYIEDK